MAVVERGGVLPGQEEKPWGDKVNRHPPAGYTYAGPANPAGLGELAEIRRSGTSQQMRPRTLCRAPMKPLGGLAQQKRSNMEDAIFMANVWKTIRENGWQSIVDYGDVDGIDFVANRILEAAQQSAPVCICNMEDGIHDWKCPARPANR